MTNTDKKKIGGKTYYKRPKAFYEKKTAKKAAEGMKKRGEIKSYRIKKVENFKEYKAYNIWFVPSGKKSVSL